MPKKKLKFEMTVETADKGYWGRLTVNDNLIVAEAGTIELLKTFFTKYLFENYGIIAAEIEIRYDISAFFQEFSFLNISEVAKHAKINPSLLRQYVKGIKNPSTNQLLKIEKALHQIGQVLSEIKLSSLS